MIICVHSAVGAALGKKLKKFPPVALAAAFLSHFVLDAIPHSEYPMRHFIASLPHLDLKIGLWLLTDLLLAGFFVWKISGPKKDRWIVISAAFLSIFPDLLFVAVAFASIGFLAPLREFHVFIHSKIILSNPLFGVLIQAAVLTMAFLSVWRKKP